MLINFKEEIKGNTGKFIALDAYIKIFSIKKSENQQQKDSKKKSAKDLSINTLQRKNSNGPNNLRKGAQAH